MYHDSDNTVVSEPERFSIETTCDTAAIDIGICRLQNIEWKAARRYRTQSHAIPDTRYEYINSLVGIRYTVYIYILLLPEWHRH